MFARGNIGVGARDINVARVFERDKRIGDGLWLREIGDVQNFHAVAVHDERVAELYGDAAGFVQRRRTDRRGYLRGERIVEIHHNQSFVGQNVCVCAGNGNAARAGQNATGIESERALQKIVRRVAVEQRAYAGDVRFQVWIADDDQAFFFISGVEKTVSQMNRLLFVFRQLPAQRVNAERGR